MAGPNRVTDMPTDRIETVLPATPASPAVARAFVGAALRRLESTDTTIEAAQLLVSELVTNAIVHVSSEVRLTVLPERDRIRIEVGDHGAGEPTLRMAGPDDLDGRGLGIVDAIARAWGSEPRRNGKSVWFELDR